MEPTKIAPKFYVSEYKGAVHLSFWPAGTEMHLSMDFSEADARRLAGMLIAQADKMPRVVSAADLGLMSETA